MSGGGTTTIAGGITVIAIVIGDWKSREEGPDQRPAFLFDFTG
jgi:hypothetical protein